MDDKTQLKEVVAQLKQSNKGQDTLNRSFDKFLRELENQRLDNLEDKKEASKGPLKAKKVNNNDVSLRKNFINPLIGLDLAKMILPLTAGFTALGLAMAGLRGWELGALKTINGMRGWSAGLSQSFINLRAKFFRKLGLDPKLGKAVDGKRSLATPLTTQLTTRITNWFSGVQQKYYKIFGLGVDGKPVTNVDAKGKIQPKSLISRLGVQINSMFAPITKLSAAIGTWFGGAGSKILDFTKNFLGKGAGFLKLIGKILWPVGIIMSLFDGVSKYQETEGTQYDKITAGIAGTVGSFLGAPLDLLKNLLAWVLGKFGFDKTAEAIKNFSIQDKITDLLTGILQFPKKAIAWIKEKFTFDDGIMKGLWTGMMATLKLVGGIAMIPMDMATSAVKWIASKFGWELPEDFTLNPLKLITKFVDNFSKLVTDLIPDVKALANGFIKKLYNKLPKWAQNAVKAMAGIDKDTPTANPHDANLGKMKFTPGIAQDGYKVPKNVSGIVKGASFNSDGTVARNISPENAWRFKMQKELVQLKADVNKGGGMGTPTILFTGDIDQSQNSSGTVVQTAPPLSPTNGSSATYDYRNGNHG